MSAPTYYETLEVAPDASIEEIRAAWERLRRLLGPGSLAVYSLVEPAEADALLRRIDEAWAVLSDPDERRRYDASLGLAPPAEAPARAPSSFEEAVARIGAAGRGRDLQAPLELAVDDADLLEVVEIDAVRMARPFGGPIPRDVGELPASVEPASVAPANEGEIVDADAIGAEPEVEDPPAWEEVPREGLEGAPAPASTHPAEPAAPTAVDGGGAGASVALVRTTTAPLAPSHPPVDAATEYTGALLRRLRLERGVGLEQLAARTRVGVAHFVNIEEERWDALPERVYLRGYLASYARELGLDAARVCATYLARMPDGRRR